MDIAASFERFRSGFSRTFWIAVTAASLVGAIALTIAIAVYARYLTRKVRTGQASHGEIGAMFLFSCAAVYLLPMLKTSQMDIPHKQVEPAVTTSVLSRKYVHIIAGP